MKLPPQVELMRLGRRKQLSFTSSRRGPAMTPQTWAFLPKASRSGSTSKCWQHQFWPVMPMPHLDFVEDEQDVVLVANAAQRLQEFAAEMVVAALTLDRLDDDGGDIRGFLREDVADLFQRQLFLLDDGLLALGRRQREIQARGDDARPGELGEIGDLARVGVRQTHRVTAAPVEGALEMDDLRAAFAAPGGEVLPDLPVHRGFESVLHGHGAAFDEEVAVQRRHAHHPRECHG